MSMAQGGLLWGSGVFQVFRVIPGFSLERRFSVDGLPCAEGPALYMGEFQPASRPPGYGKTEVAVRAAFKD